MKLLIALALVPLIFVTPSIVYATGTHSVHCVLSAGGSFPLGSTSRLTTMGFQFGGGAAVDLSRTLCLVPKLEFHTLGKGGGLSNAFLFGPDLIIGPRPELKRPSAFVLLGGGLAFPGDASNSGLGYITRSIGTHFYFNVGAGIEIASSQKCALFVTIRYANIQANGSAYGLLPISLGVKFP